MNLNTTFINKTEKEYLSEIEKIKLKNWDLISTKENFFIWKSKKGRKYKRICLIHMGFNEKSLFYWNYEKEFKPLSKIKNKFQFQSDLFKSDQTEKMFIEFINIIEMIKRGC